MRLWMVVLVSCCAGLACMAQEFQVTAIEKDGTIRWQALDGYAFTVESCDGLGASWEVVPPEEQWPIDVAEWLVNGGAGWPAVGKRFYRVEGTPAGEIHEGMVLIPGGTFVMGDAFDEGLSDELPLHEVTLSPFYMGRTEVTKGQWDQVRDWAVAHGYSSWLMSGGGKAPDHPVQNIEWYDMAVWCNARSEKEDLTPCYYKDAEHATVYRSGPILVNDWVLWDADGYRLPTEAEWEYAARGGATGRRFPWSEVDTIDHTRANYRASGGESYDDSYPAGYHPDYDTGEFPYVYTSPVASFEPNGYGLYDMAGNVDERCWDRYAAYDAMPAVNPRGPDTGSSRSYRGGSCLGFANGCRVADRKNAGDDYNAGTIGFRVVRSAP